MASITQLPDLVVKKLLSFLDRYDRFKLRLVCHTTKSWVESPQFLGLYDSFPDWDHDDDFPSPRPLPPISHTRFNLSTWDYIKPIYLRLIPSSLKFLTLQTLCASSNLLQLQFISRCTSLEALCIENLDLTTTTKALEENSEEFNGLSLVLENLKHFELCCIQIRHSAGLELETFGILLKCLKNVKTLNVPSVVEKNGLEIDENVHLSIVYGFVIGPIIKYIGRRAHDKSSMHVSNLQSLEITNFGESSFELFPELIKICNKTKTILENVNFSLINKLVMLDYDVNLLRVVGSINNSLVGSRSILPNLKNVRKVRLDLIKCDITMEISHPAEPVFPCMEELWLYIFDNSKEYFEEMGQNLLRQRFVQKAIDNIQQLLLCERESLKKLTLTSERNSRPLFISVSSIASNCKNLTCLKFKTFFRLVDTDLKSIFENLVKLQEFDVEDEWGGISDVGICISSTEAAVPLLLTLKDLKRFRILTKCIFSFGMFHDAGHCNESKLHKFSKAPDDHFISDYSFIKVFRHMRVLSFCIDCPNIHVTKFGYHALLDSELAKNVEFFPHPRYLPTGLSSQDFFKIRSRFKHLRRTISDVSDSETKITFNRRSIFGSTCVIT
ncbi:uncharacterized protein LOC110851937 [Folsomia candida]|uniref:uncharacterized protein LOC110851937 n=1 Tax=Folsomia candida TaxID=158441 RepID=UPI000B8FF2EF|nr:uncharacterized protein LOC110851937 [Folsomia candida]